MQNKKNAVHFNQQKNKTIKENYEDTITTCSFHYLAFHVEEQNMRKKCSTLLHIRQQRQKDVKK